jgi:uncharacterized membrane protein
MNQKLVALTIVVLFSLLVVAVTVFISQGRTRMAVPFAPPANDFNFSSNNFSEERARAFAAAQQRQMAEPFPVYYFIPVIAFSGLAVGASVYYISSERVERSKVDKDKFRATLLSTLAPNERSVVELLLENNGSVPQYELTRLSGMNKVQTHRLLVNMEKRGLIKKTRLGKVNKVEINKDMRALI